MARLSGVWTHGGCCSAGSLPPPLLQNELGDDPKFDGCKAQRLAHRAVAVKSNEMDGPKDGVGIWESPRRGGRFEGEGEGGGEGMAERQQRRYFKRLSYYAQSSPSTNLSRLAARVQPSYLVGMRGFPRLLRIGCGVVMAQDDQTCCAARPDRCCKARKLLAVFFVRLPQPSCLPRHHSGSSQEYLDPEPRAPIVVHAGLSPICGGTGGCQDDVMCTSTDTSKGGAESPTPDMCSVPWRAATPVTAG